MSPPPEKSNGPNSMTMQIWGNVTHVRGGWNDFVQEHAAWSNQFAKTGPVYALARKLIARLEVSCLGQPPIIDKAAALAERDLSNLCHASNAVGFFERRPISYRFLESPLPPLSPELMNSAGWTPAQQRTLKEKLTPKADDALLRVKGYAGWLLTEPAFLEAVEGLSISWQSLRQELRPSFPLCPPPTSAKPADDSTLAPEAVNAFLTAFAEFCGRWGLQGMASWDLPIPQGPFLPSSVPYNPSFMPQDGIHIILPFHYHLPGDKGFLQDILTQQQELAKQQRIDPTAAGLPHFEAYAKILEIIHWERIIDQRYGERTQRRKGGVGVKVEALAETVHLTVDQVQKWRKAVSACRRGKRQSISTLKPRSR
jgi:hypothetical protein